MKKVIVFVILTLILILALAGCNSKAVNRKNTETLAKENVASTSDSLESKDSNLSDANNYIGTYFYDYLTDTSEMVEDHYIVIENVNGQIMGRYYGTSDDFDKAREGYYPGFFVADMSHLKINDKEITFDIYLTENDMFSKPVNLRYKYSKEVPISENPTWINNHIVNSLEEKNPKNYKGKIINGDIILEVEEGQRVFKKVGNTVSKAILSGNNDESIILDYKKYIELLDVNDLNSITLAINKYEENIPDNKSVNDDLYRIFCDFYYSLIDNLNSNQDDVDKLNEDNLNRNGLVKISGEAGPFIHRKANFIKSIFYDYVSEGVQKYIDIENKATMLMKEGYLFEDALLTISWNELSDLIVLYEKYIDDYSTYEIEISKAQNTLGFFVMVYTQFLDTQTFSYMSGESDNEHELLDSYLRFVKIYPDSKYQPIIKGYLEILKNNGFTFDDEAKKYLTENGIDV